MLSWRSSTSFDHLAHPGIRKDRRSEASLQTQACLGDPPAAEERRPRADLALFNCAIDAKLRGCDLVRLRVSDVAPGVTEARATVIQQKDRFDRCHLRSPNQRGRAGQPGFRSAAVAGRLAVPSAPAHRHITTRQYPDWSIVVAMIDLEPRAYGTHSSGGRRSPWSTRRTGNLRPATPARHRKLESTVRYLGIEVDDALELSEQIDL